MNNSKESWLTGELMRTVHHFIEFITSVVDSQSSFVKNIYSPALKDMGAG